MLAQPSVPRVLSNVTPTNTITNSAKQEYIRKRRAARLHNATTPTSTSPRAWTRAQVATAATRVAPYSMSTRSRARQFSAPPQYGPSLTTHHTTGEWSPSSYGSHGCRHGQATQLQTINEKHKIQRSIEPFISQWIWKISKWHRRKNKKFHQHYRVYIPTQSTKQNKWKMSHMGYSSTRKGRTQSNMVHCRGRQNQLPRRSRHPKSGNAGGKNALQQRNLHKGCTLHDNGHRKLLPNDTATPSQIHSIETKQHTRWSNQRMQAQRESHQKWHLLHQSQARDVRPTTIRIIGKQNPQKKRLNKHGYQQSKLVPGLWKHDTGLIQFTLVVDDFGVKYVGEEHAQHLKNTLEEHYKLTCN